MHPSESDSDRHYWGALPIIERYIPEASRVLSDDQSLVGLAPGSVVEVRTRVARPGLEITKISERIDDFLLAVRLITGATVESHVEVRGRTSRIGWIRPDTTQFWSREGIEARTYRTALISRDHAEPIEGLLALLKDSGTAKPENLIDSLAVALIMFDRSHQHLPWFDRIVNLATALEATLIGDGDENAAVSLRLRQRASALLACDGDSPSTIFKDIKSLYDLRSYLVHGGNLTRRRFNKITRGISTIPPNTRPNLATELAVDRLRDIVRRSILARISLAHGENPLWPYTKSISVDEVLADDQQRCNWRKCWQSHIARMGIPEAIRPAVTKAEPGLFDRTDR